MIKIGWIIHYSDGKSLAESQGSDWADIDKTNITSIQISHKGNINTLVVPKGYFGVFQQKVGWSFFARPDLDEPLSDRQVGVVVNSDGDCIVLSVNERTGYGKIYLDNVIRMKMNLSLHQIKLEKNGTANRI